MIRLSLVGVRVEVPTNTPMVLLREDATGGRYLPIFIGQPEATAIVYALQGTETPRPMTHDLFKAVLDDLGTKVLQVVITELHDGTFFAEIELVRDGGCGAARRCLCQAALLPSAALELRALRSAAMYSARHSAGTRRSLPTVTDSSSPDEISW